MSIDLRHTRERREGAPNAARRPPRPASPLGWVIGVAAVVLLVLGALTLLGRLLPTLPNPFAVDRVDRSGPAVLQALEDLSEYRAATGHFQVILDVEDDARYLPSALRGERTLFVAAGTVEAVVDFDRLTADAVEVSSDRSRAMIELPPARLGEARVDPERSYVYERRRGLLDRIGSMFNDTPETERELYLLAQERLSQAAAETDLTDVAERNTLAMLEALLEALGFTELEVRFDGASRP